MQRFSRLALQSRYVVEGTLAGAHRSAQKGSSTEFSEHRAYIPGDDPKRLDWRVLARTEKHVVREYQDETNLRVYVVLDRSRSMDFGSGAVTKFDYAAHLAGALGYVVVKARDSIGLILHGDADDTRLEAGNSMSHLNALAKHVQAARPGEATSLADTLHRIADSIRRRALIVILSDLYDDTGAVVRALAHFRKQHHDVILLHVLDPAELDFTFRKAARFRDLETGEKLNVDPRAIRAAYREAFREFVDAYREAASSLGMDYRLARTDGDAEPFVRAYLSERRRLSK